MSGLGGSTWIVLIIAGLWLAIAGALLVIAARRMRDARAVVQSAKSMAALLDVAPVRPMIVRADGSIEADHRLIRELGGDQAPKSWDDLQGLDESDMKMLREAVQGASLSGSSIERQVKSAGSNRVSAG